MIFTEKDKRVIEKFKSAVLSVDESAEIVLFGSRARGDYNEESDYDFLILTNMEVNYLLQTKIHNEIYPIYLDEDVVLQSVVRNKIEWNGLYSVTSFFESVKEDGFKIC
jgi:predicted nucleotidyltransferase